MFYKAEQQVHGVERSLRSQGKIVEANKLLTIANVPQAVWLWGKNVASRVLQVVTAAAAKGEIPVFVIYNGPQSGRVDYGSDIDSEADFMTMILSVKNAIGNRVAWVIVEPDTLPMSASLGLGEREFVADRIKKAVMLLKENPNTKVFLDAGHPKWIADTIIADLLLWGGIQLADGFAINISNFQTTALCLDFGARVSKLVGGKHFIIDTSRNGKGELLNVWCNPPGRGLGELPKEVASSVGCDALLWIKCPGESDGTCNGGPGAGQFWPQYAIGLVDNAVLGAPPVVTPPPPVPAPTPVPVPTPTKQPTVKSLYKDSKGIITIVIDDSQ
jgi:endoglucanase